MRNIEKSSITSFKLCIMHFSCHRSIQYIISDVCSIWYQYVYQNLETCIIFILNLNLIKLCSLSLWSSFKSKYHVRNWTFYFQTIFYSLCYTLTIWNHSSIPAKITTFCHNAFARDLSTCVIVLSIMLKTIADPWHHNVIGNMKKHLQIE